MSIAATSASRSCLKSPRLILPGDLARQGFVPSNRVGDAVHLNGDVIKVLSVFSLYSYRLPKMPRLARVYILI